MISVLCGNISCTMSRSATMDYGCAPAVFTQTLCVPFHSVSIPLLFARSPHSLQIESSAGAPNRFVFFLKPKKKERNEKKNKKNEKQLPDQFVSFITNPHIYYVSFSLNSRAHRPTSCTRTGRAPVRPPIETFYSANMTLLTQ